MTVIDPRITVLGPDPPTQHRINSNAFQQNALYTHNNYQYACLWTPSPALPFSERQITLCRRPVRFATKWEVFTFVDYAQTTDDGHNIISLGICPGDGTIHISFDHHCDDLKYRVSVKDLASRPEDFQWNAEIFGQITNYLPGTTAILRDISYPQFVATNEELLLSYRVGKAGEGSNYLHTYHPSTSTFTTHGAYLHGVASNPYINGLSYCLNTHRLHISWTYRHFVAYDDSSGTAHKAQAGPNGPENNAGLHYAYSDDNGETWMANNGTRLKDGGIYPGKDIVGLDIPKNSGIMNQEGQCVDRNGMMHVLNRDNTSGIEQWKHYTRQQNGSWDIKALPAPYTPTTTGPRGKLFEYAGHMHFILPSNYDDKLYLVKAVGKDDYELLWEGSGYDGEPLIDEGRVLDGVLSVFTRTKGDSSKEGRKVVVLDFTLNQ